MRIRKTKESKKQTKNKKEQHTHAGHFSFFRNELYFDKGCYSM